MPTYEDPIRALRVDLAPGWAYDPFTSALKDFYFAPWSRAEEILIVNVEPARLSSNQPDEMWLAQVKDEFTAKGDFVDSPSVSGRAIAAAIYHPDGHVQRVAVVRGARVDFALEHNGVDPDCTRPLGSAEESRAQHPFRREHQTRRTFRTGEIPRGRQALVMQPKSRATRARPCSH